MSWDSSRFLARNADVQREASHSSSKLRKGRFYKSEHPERFSTSYKKPSKFSNIYIWRENLPKKGIWSHLQGSIFYTIIHTPACCKRQCSKRQLNGRKNKGRCPLSFHPESSKNMFPLKIFSGEKYFIDWIPKEN